MLDWIIKQTPFSQAQNPSPVGFHIEYEPSIIETNSNIIVTCWKSKAKDGIVPCTFSWTRCRNGVTSSIQHAKGSTYLCDPNDLGCSIRVEVTVTSWEIRRVLTKNIQVKRRYSFLQSKSICWRGRQFSQYYLPTLAASQCSSITTTSKENARWSCLMEWWELLMARLSSVTSLSTQWLNHVYKSIRESQLDWRSASLKSMKMNLWDSWLNYLVSKLH